MVVRAPIKILSGILLGLAVLAIVFGMTAYFALRNFDLNKLRPELERQMSRQIGFRVELGTLRLQWRPTPQLQVEGLKFFHLQSHEKLLQSDRVRIDVDLTSVWRKRLGASQVVIQNPEIFLTRDRQGVWNWQAGDQRLVSAAAAAPLLSKWSLIPVAEAAEGSGNLSMISLGNVAQGWEFGIAKIVVGGATVHFSDETIEPVFRLDLAKLEAEVRQKTYGSSFHFTAAGNLFNATQKNLEAEGDLDLASKSLDLTLRYGPEKVVFKGLLQLINAQPQFGGTLEIKDLDMEPLIPVVYKKSDYISGRLSAKAQISLDGANPEMIKRTLKGQGTTGIKDGALRNRNVVKEVFDRLSPVLSITSALGGALPPELNEMLKDRDTPFQSLQVVYTVEAGIVKVAEFRLLHSNYQLSGKGTYGMLDQRVDGSMELLLSKSISAFMIQKIRELGMIADRSGQVMIPFRYRGVLPEAAIQPDLPYMTARLLQGGADQFLSRIMGTQKSNQTSSAASAAETDQTTQPLSKKEKKKQWIAQGLSLLNQIQEPSKQ